MPIGSIISETSDLVTIDADWIIEIKTGSYAFRVVDFNNNSNLLISLGNFVL